MKSKTHVVAHNLKALGIGKLNMVKFSVAGIEKTKLYKVKGQKLNFSVNTVLGK